MKTKIKVLKGDIAQISVDAIVNAANISLQGGGGVDGAIHLAAGPELAFECSLLNGCQTSEVKITRGHNLPAKHVIHTVGPVYGGENGQEQKLLYACYFNSLQCAKENSLRSIAFPAISTGVFRYPKEEAVLVAGEAVRDFVRANPDVFDEIIFVLHTDLDYRIYAQTLLDHIPADVATLSTHTELLPDEIDATLHILSDIMEKGAAQRGVMY